MSKRRMVRYGRFSPLLVGLLGLACDPKSHPETIDSQTNWLRSCENDKQCGEDSCLCGICTTPCAEDTVCDDRGGSSCVDATEDGAIAQCGGVRPPATGMCLRRCDDQPCGRNQMCVAGVCTPVPTAEATVKVDTRYTHQTLVGFGATVAYGEDEITSHPQKDALYTTLFSELGLDVLRLRDRFGHTGDDNLATARTLIDAATASLGHPPTVIMTSWSPPPALKQNAAVQCAGNPATCTLTKTAAGEFDYAGFATFIRSSLDAYAQAGVVPDYFGIQNNPNWLPTAAEPGEACRFLPTEGSTTVTARGTTTTVRYPGFDQAQATALTALKGLKKVPNILAPETSDFASVADYLPKFDVSQVAAIAHHLYGIDPEALDTDALAQIGELAAQNSLPIFQTEMQADGFGTALFIHYTTVIEGASAYLQTTLTGSASGPTANPQALVGLDANAFYREDPYFAYQHYALHTDPGWVRVDALSNTDTLLSSAWLAPNGYSLTVVLVNSGNTDVSTKLDLGGSTFTNSAVTRTVFSGSERGTNLGRLSVEGVLNVPARAVVTVAFTP